MRPESPEPEEAKHENGEKAGPVAAMGVEEGPHNWRQRVAGWVPGKGDGTRWGATYPTQLRILFIRWVFEMVGEGVWRWIWARLWGQGGLKGPKFAPG